MKLLIVSFYNQIDSPNKHLYFFFIFTHYTEMQHSIKIPALGRVSQLGALYSVHTEQFLPGLNLFKEEISKEVYDEYENAETSISYSTSNSITEKIKALNINGEISLSLMSGMINVSGSASFLKSERKNTNVSEMTFLYSVTTMNQIIPSVMCMTIEDEMLNVPDVTHVVVGIDWGAKCNISCQYENKTNKNEMEVNGMLKGLVEKMSLQVEGKADYTDKDDEVHNKFTFQSKCDVSKMDRIPQSFGEAVSLVAELPEAIKEINDGKGVPVDYHLLPLNVVAKVCKKQLNKAYVVNEIEGDTIQHFSQLVERTAECKLKFQTMINIIDENEDWFTNEQLQKAKSSKDKLEVVERKYKTSFQNALARARAGKGEISSLTEIIDEALNPEDGIPSFESAYLDQSKLVKKALEIIQVLKLPNVEIVGSKGFEECQTVSGKKFMLFLPENLLETDLAKMTENIMLFKRFAIKYVQEENDPPRFFVVLTSFNEVAHSTPILRKYNEGRLVDEDMCKTEGWQMKGCYIEVPKEDFRYDNLKSKEEVPLKIRCPHFYGDCSKMKQHEWKHIECRGDVRYGIDTKLMYCGCGSFNPDTAKFRCSDPNHGIDFHGLNKDSKTEIGKLETKEVTNILILGESGVGKSTWINSIVKYLHYNTLSEAMSSGDTSVLIPSKFSITKADGTTIDIKVGDIQDNNESKTTGESATQRPTSYLFNMDDGSQICLIDTPGIGDSRGIQQDEKNFEMILEHLSFYKRIHGICILLKPNNARLNVMLKFCIGELLTHLHKSAANNIVFCFTNCRGTFYQPGETLPVLMKLLDGYKKSQIRITPTNRFCFDNESFRLLACIQNEVEFSDAEIKAYSGSWDQAVLETKRLFEYVRRIEPHNTESTLNLNTCRKWILELSKPIAEIQNTVQNNIKQIELEKEKIKAIRKKGGDLMSQMYIKCEQLTVVEIDYPRTVCKDEACIIIEKVSEIQTIIYIRIVNQLENRI